MTLIGVHNMSFNETMVLRKLQRRLGSKLFEAIDTDFFINILYEETIDTFSTYYPKLVKGIKITKENAIPTYDPINHMQQFHRYKIPKYSDIEYIGIEQCIMQDQGYDNVFTGLNPPLADAAFNKIRSLMPYPVISYTTTFEAPDFCIVNPYRANHMDFVLIMQRKVRLEEVSMGLQEYFIRLYAFDCKLAIYNEFPSARESGTINGIEVNTNISDFSNASSDREALLDVFEGDYYTNPERFSAMFSQQ
jgi:hypothetical protein